MKGFEIREARPSDIPAMKRHLRAEDAAEVMASDGQTPAQALTESFAVSSHRYSLVWMGKPIAMFGLVPSKQVENSAVVWLLATRAVDHCPKTFLVLSVEVVREFLKAYAVLFNFVDARYTRSVIWLKRLGATMGDPIPYGRAGLPFIPFAFRRPPNV